jgi:formylglycine-generating enzyme required for sulfatase activity
MTRVAEMIHIAGSAFERGSELSPDEQPVQRVELRPYAIDRTPITNADFEGFVSAGGYEDPQYWTASGWEYVQVNDLSRPTYFDDPVWNPPEMPVTGVSWWEALAYARFAGKTLPTEAQWEFACRGPDGRTFPWGEEEPTLEHANFAPECEPEDRRPTAPDAHPKNVSYFGCLDMAGNFAEWCLDNYVPHYRFDGAAGPDPLNLVDEHEPHVVRGGCGLHTEDYMRCSSRDSYPPGIRDNLIGFRCVASEVPS